MLLGLTPLPPCGHPPLCSQYSSSWLCLPYENGEQRSGTTSPATHPLPSHVSQTHSMSQLSTYIPKTAPPPLPSSGWDQAQGSTSMTTKRSSGSSQSTGENFAYSPNSSSPPTPFGSSDSLFGRSSISSYDAPLRVKVHFGSDIFVIQVLHITEYDGLIERVGKKIHLCGPRWDDGPLRVKYEDKEGDFVSMRSTEEVGPWPLVSDLARYRIVIAAMIPAMQLTALNKWLTLCIHRSSCDIPLLCP